MYFFLVTLGQTVRRRESGASCVTGVSCKSDNFLTTIGISALLLFIYALFLAET